MIPLKGQQRNEDPFGAHLKLIALSMLNRQLLRAGSLLDFMYGKIRPARKKDGYASLPCRRFCVNSLPSMRGFA